MHVCVIMHAYTRLYILTLMQALKIDNIFLFRQTETSLFRLRRRHYEIGVDSKKRTFRHLKRYPLSNDIRRDVRVCTLGRTHHPLSLFFDQRYTVVALTFFMSLETFLLTFLRMRNKCKIINVQQNNKAFSV